MSLALYTVGLAPSVKTEDTRVQPHRDYGDDTILSFIHLLTTKHESFIQNSDTFASLCFLSTKYDVYLIVE